MAPRARHSPSTITGSNGGLAHSSRGSTGCTSWWPYTRTVGAPSTAWHHSPYTAGPPPVPRISTPSRPASERSSAQKLAERCRSPFLSGWAEIDGMRSQSKRAPTIRSLSAAAYAARTGSGITRKVVSTGDEAAPPNDDRRAGGFVRARCGVLVHPRRPPPLHRAHRPGRLGVARRRRPRGGAGRPQVGPVRGGGRPEGVPVRLGTGAPRPRGPDQGDDRDG